MKAAFARLTVFALVAMFPAAFAQAKAPAAPQEAPAAAVKEADYAKALLGSWKLEFKQEGVTGFGVSTYLEGGKITSFGSLDAGGQKIEMTAKATWKLEKDQLTIVIIESSLPEAMPVGSKTVETIISLSDKEFKYRDEAGEVIVEKRVVLDKDGKLKPDAK